MKQFKFKLDKIKKDKYEITSQGFLKCDAYATRSGIFTYYNEDRNDENYGQEIKELRPEEEVFNQDSLSSLALCPITDDHPDDMITVDNVKNHQIGFIGENITREDNRVKCKVVITDKNVIQNILQKHNDGQDIELSCGYDCELFDEKGEDEKEGKYDCVQRNIKYNHLSIVDEGRAGNSVKLKMDKAKDKRTAITEIILK